LPPNVTSVKGSNKGQEVWSLYLEEIEKLYAELTSSLLAAFSFVFQTTGKKKARKFNIPVPSENSDLREISDRLLFVSYFASQNKEIQWGNCFFDVCCAN